MSWCSFISQAFQTPYIYRETPDAPFLCQCPHDLGSGCSNFDRPPQVTTAPRLKRKNPLLDTDHREDTTWSALQDADCVQTTNDAPDRPAFRLSEAYTTTQESRYPSYPHKLSPWRRHFPWTAAAHHMVCRTVQAGGRLGSVGLRTILHRTAHPGILRLSSILACPYRMFGHLEISSKLRSPPCVTVDHDQLSSVPWHTAHAAFSISEGSIHRLPEFLGWFVWMSCRLLRAARGALSAIYTVRRSISSYTGRQSVATSNTRQVTKARII